MKNERGSTLIIVLFVSLVLLTIGLTAFSTLIGGTKRTSIRETDVVTTQDSISEMNTIIADFKQNITNLAKDTDLKELVQQGTYETKLQKLQMDLMLKYTNKQQEPATELLIIDRTESLLSSADDANDYKEKYLTRYYEFSLTYTDNTNKAQPNITKTIKRNVYVSPTPSFLQYAAGSEGILNMNGASAIIGNVYGSTINIANTARYANQTANSSSNNSASIIFNKTETTYPAIQGDIVLDSTLNLFNGGTSDDASPIRTVKKYELAFQNKTNLLPYFYTTNNTTAELPNIRKPNDSFVSMDFLKTFADNLQHLNIEGQNVLIQKDDLDPAKTTNVGNTVVQKIFAPAGGLPTQADIAAFNSSYHTLYVIDKNINPADIAKDFTTATLSSKKVIVLTDVQGNNSSNGNAVGQTKTADFVMNSDVKLNPDQWIVVNGDLEIYTNNTPLTLQGKLLVLGNITIHGNTADFGHTQDQILVDSVIYTTGNATVDSTNITGLNGKQLILLSQGDLLITRINEFNRADDTNNTPMDAYFYTDGNAELYGVGSLFTIHGGIFAKHMLTINAIRQNNITAPSGTDMTFAFDSVSMQNMQKSRFNVQYDKSVLLNQLDALPIVNELQVIVDDYTIER